MQRKNHGQDGRYERCAKHYSATPPKGAAKADMSGERMGKRVGGVAMGKEDAVGSDKLFNTGRTAGICYTHTRDDYK